MHWKVARDHFYKDVPPEQLEEAGFFYDSAAEDVNVLDSLDIMCTPVEFLRTAQAVVVFCGCFGPFHEGHMHVIERAMAVLWESGYWRVKCLISPDHDEYMGTKSKDFPIDKRIQIIQDRIKDNSNYAVDPWAGIFCKGAVNFTDVVFRTEEYIKRHLGKEIPVFFVCGGDNARFALAFKERGNCIIVGRPNYENKYNHLVDNKRIFYVDGYDSSSSTEKRKATYSFKERPSECIIRVDSINQDECSVAEILRRQFDRSKLVFVEAQREVFSKIQEKTISLDPLIKGTYNLELSRCFDYGGMYSRGIRSRPEGKPFEDQLKAIPPDKYVLFDDDQMTGRTLSFAEKFITLFGSKILRQETLSKSLSHQEILDARDFLYQYPNGGLVVNGKRVPYVWPFVNPAIRASVADSRQFSIDIWKLNARLSEGPKKEECLKFVKLLE
jgi:nicotinic acid mononucleotide adenylyltransferase